MATSIQIPISEYLETSYRPDCDYIDGELQERNVGQREHARVQYLLAAWFGTHEAQWGVVGSTEQRIRVAPSRVRIADLAFTRPVPQPDVFTDAPLLIIEVLSPDDSYSALQKRCEDYLSIGGETIWIIDPETRTDRMCSQETWVAAARLEVPGTPIYVELPELFSQIDSQPHA